MIYQALGMTQAVWRNNLTPSQRKAFRVAWEAQQEEAQIEALKSPGYVYVLRHPRYAELCKVGETVNPVNRLRNYNCGDRSQLIAFTSSSSQKTPVPSFTSFTTKPTPSVYTASGLT